MEYSKKTIIGIFCIIAISIIVIAAFLILQYPNFNSGDITDDQSDLPINVTVVASVNGDEITTLDIYNDQQTYIDKGDQISEEQSLEQLINQTLLYQQAIQGSYDLTDEETESELDALLMQSGLTLDAYKLGLEDQGYSYDEIFPTLKKQFSIQKYLDATLDEEDFNVSDEEAEEYYETYIQQNGGEVQPYEQMETQIKQYLQQVKRQEAIILHTIELRETADITYY